jgi:hypothetical protein
LILCDDFEHDSVGATPMGMPWLDEQCADSARVLKVDAAVSHSGTQSLVSQGIGYAQCMLHADLGTLPDFWVRSWVRFGTGADFMAHEVTVFELGPNPDQDDPSIRVGFRGNTCDPVGAEVNITGNMEETGCTGFSFEAEKWYCLELHVTQGASGVTTDLFIDGEDQSYKNHGVAMDTISDPMGKPLFRYLKLGYRAYSGGFNASIWNDDVAVGTQRVGCQ